jgi:type II secretory ATPase GspE/PulE/Tfp pilus assembly ATPase PilB-like protein
LRTVCTACRVELEPDEETLRELGPDARRIAGQKISHGRGCDACHHTGYKGRSGIFEILILDDTLRSMIQEGVSSEALRRAAIDRGMSTLREAGLEMVAAGRTTVEEVLRETQL